MNDLIRFDFQQNQVRVTTIDGEPWFLASDVCHILGLTNAREAVSRLDDDERKLLKNNSVTNGDGVINQALNENQQINLINESGLYSLVFASRKPEAKMFRKWVTSELLPTIRKTGSYAMTTADTTAALLEQDLAVTESTLKEARYYLDAAKKLLGGVPFKGPRPVSPASLDAPQRRPRYCFVTPALMAEIRASEASDLALSRQFGLPTAVICKVRNDPHLIYRPYNGRSVGPLPEPTPTLPPPPQPWWPANARSH